MNQERRNPGNVELDVAPAEINQEGFFARL